MADLTPNNREEHWLQGMVDGSTNLEPNKRREYWYKEIVDAIGSGGGGGGGGVLVVNVNMQTGVFDTTWDEINTARFAVVPFQTGTDVFIFTLTHIQPYTVTFNCANNSAPFPSFLATADNGSDYPVVQMG